MRTISLTSITNTCSSTGLLPHQRSRNFKGLAFARRNRNAFLIVVEPGPNREQRSWAMAGKKSSGGKGVNYRNSDTGRYTTKSKADKKPKEHEKEKRK